MKKLFNLVLWTVIFNSLAISAPAQSSSACFMLDANGKAIDLGYLCQNSNSTNSRPARSILVPTRSIAEPGVQIVPIKSRRSGIPVIEVKFDDRYTFEMMLDTGASGIYITKQMAEILKVTYTETDFISTASSDSVEMPAGYVYSVGVGKLTQKNPRVTTLPTMDMGLLGQSFFSNYDMTIKSDVVEFRER